MHVARIRHSDLSQPYMYNVPVVHRSSLRGSIPSHHPNLSYTEGLTSGKLDFNIACKDTLAGIEDLGPLIALETAGVEYVLDFVAALVQESDVEVAEPEAATIAPIPKLDAINLLGSLQIHLPPRI